ncbi:MAG: hypothetical protein GEV10_21620 [Streptosporangiales bacterium]|nr:hypothetical protein [Streptosporangiales bacterium]
MSTRAAHRRLLRRSRLIAALAVLTMVVSCGQATSTSDSRTALVAMVQEPGLLNPFFNDQSGSDISYAFTIEQLFQARPDGSYEPNLAAEIPTVENGAIRDGGKVVTYRLREGITWSDGEPFTADDLAFTVGVYQHPKSVALVEPDYALVDSVKVVDELTAEVRMTEPNPGYLNLFRQVLPKHEFDSTAVSLSHPQARLPLGTGPFVYTSWRTGDRITLVRNPHYWRDPELPRLDGVTIKVTPDKQATMSAFANGESDTVYFFSGDDLVDLTAARERRLPVSVRTDGEHTGSVEWLWLNHSARGNPHKAHPILGDPAVREAIDVAIDRRALVDGVLSGFGELSGSLVYAGFGAEQTRPARYDQRRADALLDAAGWRRGDDGVRVKDGVRASMKFQTITGDQTRVLYQQLIQHNLEQVGIELKIQNVPSNTMFGAYADGGLLATGNYDIMMSRAGADYPEPGPWVQTFVGSEIPTEKNPNGFTYAHWRNARFDRLAAEVTSTIDQDERRRLFGEMNTLFARERVALPLYGTVRGWAWNSRLENMSTDYWEGFWTTSSTARWSVD